MRCEQRKTGLPLIGDLPWGSHFCQFYQNAEELLDVLLPYFRAGLENNELCIWVTAGVPGEDDALKSLAEAAPDVVDSTRKGQLEMIPYGRWRAMGESTRGAVDALVDRAVNGGFDGLRLVRGAFRDKEGDLRFIDREREAVGGNNVLALFTYPRGEFDALGLMEVVRNHRCALVSNAGTWEVIESTEARTVRDELKRSSEKLKSLFSNMSEGLAYNRIVLDAEGKPCDFILLEVNEAFERILGLSAQDVIGRRITEALPGIENDKVAWIGKFGDVALTGSPVQFESFSELLRRWFSVSAFCPSRGYFALMFSDITERKRAEEALHRSNARLDLLADTAGTLLVSDSPQKTVEDLCQKVMAYLECDVFFNFVTVEGGKRLRLNACAGIPAAEAEPIEWLDSGVAVCGCAARDACRIVTENIQETPDPRTELVKSYGVRAYACHPLMSHGLVIGTLACGTRTRDVFTDDDLALMKVVADQVAIAMERKRSEEDLRRAHDELEQRVRERTEELASTIETLLGEMSERERAEEALRQETLERLRTVEALREKEQLLMHQSRLAAMGEMINNIAHQWRQPLNLLGLVIQELPLKYEMGDFTREYLEARSAMANELVRHMSRTIDDFRNFFRPDKEKVDFSVNEVVNKTLSLVEESFRNNNIAVEVAMSGNPVINGYPNEYSQVLLNVLMNAKDAYGERNVPPPRLVTVTSGTENGRAFVAIADNAGGIPAGIMDKIFDPYFTTKGPDKGTGVGLFMARTIIGMSMNGSITARNTGVGAEFRIEV
ncbi:MAG TPA: MEDS domain-containing protein [Geobacteraceae bacterium]